jgi:hypothetical protein
MPAAASRPTQERWCDSEGVHLSLFCWVEQVTDNAEPGALPSRLHHRGQILGRGLESLYVRFEGSNQLVSVPARLLRLLPDAPGGC